MKDIIRLVDVNFSYIEDENEAPTALLENFNLTIEKGSFVSIIGHNGSGKSTLAKLLNGLSKPDSGEVFVNGKSTTDENSELEIRKTVGLVFQNPDNQIVTTIVEEDVAFGPENLGIAPEEIRKRVDDALKTVDMYEYRRHATYKLSGGQKQRIAIAGIIAMCPECIVLDEPTAMLDPKGREEVINTIHYLNKEKGITIILVTHFMNEAIGADRVIVMNDGKIILDGNPVDVFSKPEEIKAVELDLPQPAELAYELRKSGVSIPKDILTVEGCVNAIAKLLEE